MNIDWANPRWAWTSSYVSSSQLPALISFNAFHLSCARSKSQGFPVEEETGWNMRWKILFGLTSWDRLRQVEDETGEITGENMIWSHLWSVDPFCCLDGSLQPRGPNTYIWDMQQFKHDVYYMYISERCNINTFQALEKSNYAQPRQLCHLTL